MYKNNYETKNYNNNRSRYNNRKPRQPRVNLNKINAPIYIPEDTNGNVHDEILEVLSSTKFDKISFPLNTYRALIDSNVDASDARTCTIGHICGYNSELEEFSVFIFSKFLDAVKSLGDIAIEIHFSGKDKLNSITKFNLVTVEYEEDNSEE